MAAATFQYLDSGTWVTETNYISLTLTDNLYLPMELMITISNVTGNTLNSRESVYTSFQKVRVIEGNSGRLLFYGKIKTIQPNSNSSYGQTIQITAYDNLNELTQVEMNDNVTFSSSTLRSLLIKGIINGTNGFRQYAWPNNILTTNTDKLQDSTTAEAGDVLNKNLEGTSKTPLQVLTELALQDPQDSPNTEKFAHDFYLDNTFDTLIATGTGAALPDLHYFSRGTVPNTPATNGLTLQYKGAEGNQTKAVFPNFSFPREFSETISKVRAEYVTPLPDRNPATKEVILLNHGTTTGGNFAIGDTITWISGTKSAIVEYVLPDNKGILISSNGDTTWLYTSTSGAVITNGTVSATVNATTYDPPGSAREVMSQDVETVIRNYENESSVEVLHSAAEVLRHGVGEVVRGQVTVFKWPYHKITGTNTGTSATVLTDAGASFINNGVQIGDEVTNTTDSVTGLVTGRTATTITTSAGGMSWNTGDTYEFYVLARTGHSVYLKDFPPSNIADQEAIITRIEYQEGPGIQQSTIELLLHTTGRGASLARNSSLNTQKQIKTGNIQSPGQTGKIGLADISWGYDGPFTADSDVQVSWASGTLTLSNGETFSIDAGNTGGISARTYIFFDKDASTTTFSTTTTLGNAIGANRIVIAWAINGTTEAQFRVFGPPGDIGVDVAAATIDESIMGWNETITFSSTDADTVSWGTGDIILSGGTTYNIVAGNTGNMVARTYIYLDINASTTVLQTTTTASTAIGTGKILIGTAINSTNEAKFFIFGGAADKKISGPDIEANSITANEILANTITANEIAANTITAGEIFAGTITATEIAAEYVLSNKFVTSANVGESGGPAGIRIDSNGVRGFSGGTTISVDIDSATGSLLADSGNVTIDASGLTVINSLNLTAGSVGGSRVELTSSGIAGYDATNTKRWDAIAGGTFTFYGALGGSLFWNSSSVNRGQIVVGASSNFLLSTLSTGYDLELQALGTGDDIILNVTASGTVRPANTNSDLGSPSFYWDDFYVDFIHTDNLWPRSGSSIVLDSIISRSTADNIGSATDYFANIYGGVIQTDSITPLLGASTVTESLIASSDGVDNIGSASKGYGDLYVDELHSASAVDITVHADFIPSTTLNYNLGDATHYYSTGFFQNLDITNTIQILERVSAPTGVTNTGIIYATVAGGKTQLRAIFQTGISQLIAAEP